VMISSRDAQSAAMSVLETHKQSTRAPTSTACTQKGEVPRSSLFCV
jgi:hypothetical protein